MEMPNSRGCDEFSELLQTVLFTMGDTGLNAVYNANADIWHVPRELDVMVREWESLNAKAELARMHRDRHCHETVVWYVHHLPESMKNTQMETSSPTLEESYRRATTQGPIIEREFTRISRAGTPKRPLPNCQAGPTASSTPLFQDAQMPWGGHS